VLHTFQVELLGKHLSTVKFTRIYSSDYIRAKDTAEAILKHSENASSIQFFEDLRLRERVGQISNKVITNFLTFEIQNFVSRM